MECDTFTGVKSEHFLHNINFIVTEQRTSMLSILWYFSAKVLIFQNCQDVSCISKGYDHLPPVVYEIYVLCLPFWMSTNTNNMIG